MKSEWGVMQKRGLGTVVARFVLSGLQKGKWMVQGSKYSERLKIYLFLSNIDLQNFSILCKKFPCHRPVCRQHQITWYCIVIVFSHCRSDIVLSLTLTLSVLLFQTLHLDLFRRDLKFEKGKKEEKVQSVWWGECSFKRVKNLIKVFFHLLCIY